MKERGTLNSLAFRGVAIAATPIGASSRGFRACVVLVRERRIRNSNSHRLSLASG